MTSPSLGPPQRHAPFGSKRILKIAKGILDCQSDKRKSTKKTIDQAGLTAEWHGAQDGQKENTTRKMNRSTACERQRAEEDSEASPPKKEKKKKGAR